ncbi:unnamed protein product [Symbiodinium sp. CCMP2592]|nr:unnamed protein product [Symbiodinium sp. CCMP2592]
MGGRENTSSTTTCKVAPGPVDLDTGQQVAKHLQCDPDRLDEFYIAGGEFGSSARQDRVRRHVGYSSLNFFASIAAVVPSMQGHFDWKHATRIGEASNPGPSGGGSRATARRRAEMEVDDGGDGGFGGLAGLLRPMLETLIRELLQELLAEGGLKGMIADMLGGRVPATSSRAPSAAHSAGEVVPEEGANKKGRWDKRRGDDDDEQPKGKGKGKNNSGEQAKGKGKNDLAKGNGKDNGGDQAGKGKSSHGDLSKGKGKHNGGEQAGKGLGSRPDAADGAEWTVVGPAKKQAEWQLRGSDWTEAVMTYDALVAAFGSDSNDAVKGVVLASDEEFDTLKTLLRGSSKAHGVLLVHQNKDASQRCPGVTGSKLSIRTVDFHRSYTPGLVAPQPRAAAAAQKLEPKQSSVVYARFLQKFMPADKWKEIVKQPQRAFHGFLAQHRLRALDSWGWQIEQVQATPYQKVFGCGRLLNTDVETLLSLSGKNGLFFDVARGFPLGPVQTEWHSQQESENATDFLNRLLTIPSDFGLIAGAKQIGKRLRRDPNQPVQRHWVIDGVPRDVSPDDLRTVLQAGHFEDVEMTLQRRHGNLMAYHFRAKTLLTADSLAVPLLPTQTIATSGAWRLEAPRSKWSTERVAVELDDEDVDASAGALVINTREGEVTAAGNENAEKKDAGKRGGAATGSAAKRAAGVQRALPEGAKVTKIEKDGNCLFSGLAKDINNLKPSGHQLTGAEVRAKIAVHLRRNEDKYAQEWDKEMPNRSKAENWEAYVSAIEVDQTWGGLPEIRAASRIWDVRVIIFPTSQHIEPFHVHGQARKRVLSLLFTGSHFDLIEGDNGSLPRALLNIKAPPPAVPMRGGGRASDDGASVWTRSSVRSRLSSSWAASVWTTASGDGKAEGSQGPHDDRSRESEGACTPGSVWTQATAAGAKRRCASSASASDGGGGGPARIPEDAASGTVARLGGRTPSLVAEIPEEPRTFLWRHPGLQADGSFKLGCELCAKIFHGKDSTQLAKRRYRHYQSWHPDAERNFGRYPSSVVELRPLPKDTQVDWRCPCCRYAVPRGELQKASSWACMKAREAHRLKAHPALSRSAYAACARNVRKDSKAMKLRVLYLNQGLAKRQAKGSSSSAADALAGFESFTWPVRRSDKKRPPKLMLRAAWRCRECRRCYLHLRDLRSHRCDYYGHGNKARVKALRKLRREAPKMHHGIAEDLLKRTFDNALRMLQGEDQVHWLGDLFFDTEFPIDVLAVQELNLDSLSAASFVAILKDRGVHVFLSAEDNGVYRCAVLSTHPGVAVGVHSGRLAAACFEFLCNGSFIKVAFASYYGVVWNADVAMQGALDAVAELRATRVAWVLLGDYNLEPSLEPLASHLARGFAVPWDRDFESLEQLPGTRESGRRLDFALGCGILVPSGLRQRWTFNSDHAQVCYEVDLTSPSGCCGPTFCDLSKEAITEAAWASSAASSRIFFEFLVPRGAAALRCGGRVLDFTLAARQLAHDPGHARLRDKAAKLLDDLLDGCPWLAEVPYFQMEQWADFVAEHLVQMEAAQKEAALAAWRVSMEESEGKVISWIRRREKLKVELDRPRVPSGDVYVSKAVHPVRVIAEAEDSWMRLWGRSTVTGRVPDLLRPLPTLPEAAWHPSFTAEALYKAGKQMATKAAGPDGWTTGQWCLLPMSFWEALAALWTKVLDTGVAPEVWRRGRVVLIPKPTSGHRPLTVLSCAWRVGAKLLVGQLADWLDTWASHRVLGGVHSRGVRDSFLRIMDSLDNDLQASLEKLGAPQVLCRLLRDFYGGHSRVFTHNGTTGAAWHKVLCGIPQGCPLSPLLAGVVMALWSQHVEVGGAGAVQTVSFVDDRLFWSSAPATLAAAKLRSSAFDSAYGFSCDVSKSKFVHRASDAEVRALAADLGYDEADCLTILGLVIPLDRAEVPMLKGFDLEKVRRRLRLIAVAVRSLATKCRFMNMLVLPMLTWAGGYASVPQDTMEALMADFRWLLHKDLAADSPPVLCYELAGWEVHPGYARDLAALRGAAGLHCRVPVWLEEASVRLAGQRWPAMLPVTREVLANLGWWCDARGSFILRRDSYGQVRSFEVGVDSFETVAEWLRDAYRRRGLANCGRVVKALHREEEPDLAQDLALPGPPKDYLAVFAGHRWAWRSSSDTLERRSAMVTGCSAWFKHKKLMHHARDGAGPPDCLCSKRLPSRPHLLWNCPATRDLVADVSPPVNRLQERLLACEVPEVPGPPLALDLEDYIDDIAEALDARLALGSPIYVATDGSVVDLVAAWAIALDGEVNFAQPVAGEDQSSHRAEVDGLIFVAKALGRCSAEGEVHVIADCQSALTTVTGGGALPLLSSRAVAAFRDVPRRIKVKRWWVPSHGKMAPAAWQPPPCGEMVARALNFKADQAARAKAQHLATGSLRQRCVQARAAALEWEQKAHRALRSVARRWAAA